MHDPETTGAIKFELVAIPLVVILLVAGSRWLRFRLRQFVRGWSRVARRRALSIRLVAVVALLTGGLCNAIDGLPVPQMHDEFSYLLAADTFAHARLTNATHPMWRYFESFHIIQQPTYASKFLPGQGLFLALGQVGLGHPAMGVWLSFVLACAATCWMLQAWLPPRWALLGGILAAVHPRLVLDWSHTYWGGSVAMLGGALLFGSLRRLLRQPRGGWGLGLGAGLALLAITRPAEGLAASIPALCVLTRWLVTRGSPIAGRLRILLGVATVLVSTGGFLALTNYRVTGSPLRLPYQIHEDTYGIAPIFIWQQPKVAPEYRHAVLGDFHRGWSMDFYHRHFPLSRMPAAQADKALWLWRFYLKVALSVPLVTLPWIARDPWMRFALLTIALVLLCLFLTLFMYPHYASPITCLILLIVVQGMRQLWVGSRQRPWLRLLVPALLVLWPISMLITVCEGLPADSQQWNMQRARLATDLARSGEKHLVIVRYTTGHPSYREWVYNAADIDAAPVVWARDMGTERDRKLLNYFGDRRVWLLEVDGDAVCKPYPRLLLSGP